MKRPDYNKQDIPTTPGIYLFKGGKDILYIGKATNLKQRTLSYFQPKLMETRGPQITNMVELATSLEYQSTDSVLEALLLESHLIKKHQPIYNTKEKDDKSYNYVVITNETYPRVFTVRKRQLDILRGKKEKIRYTFGPFPHGALLREALNIMRKIFPFYGKRGRGSYVEEFYQQLSLHPSKQINQRAYRENIEYLALFFEGKKKSIIRSLKKKMKTLADEMRFEEAGIVKSQIRSLEHIHDMALMKKEFQLGTEREFIRIEAYDVAHHQGQAMVGVMVVHNGSEISHEDQRLFTIRSVSSANDTKALQEMFDRRLSHTEWPYPRFIVVDGGSAQKRALELVLRKRELAIPVIAVVKNEKHKAKALLGRKNIIEPYEDVIVAINAESHRFALKAHTKKINSEFITK